MKKTLRNIARLLIAVITMTTIMSSLSVQGTSNVEGSYWLEFYERIINPLPETVFVGMEYPVPVFKKTAKNIPTHQVNLYTIKEISDPSMLLVDGKPYDKETTEITQNSKLEFTKEGTFTLFHKTYWQWNYTTDPRFYEGQSRGYSGDAQYKVVVKKRNSFTRDINITYDKPFRTGEPFPEFTLDTDEVYVSRAYFEIRGGGAEYNFYPYFGIKGDLHDRLWANGGGLKHVDTIPELYGGEETYVYLWLEPRKTYNFGWKDKDGDLYWSDAVSNVTVNDKKYKASVSNYNDGMILQVAFPVRIEGEVERVEITDLTAPAHKMELDRTAAASVGTVTSVDYETPDGYVTEVDYGDEVNINVTVELPENFSYSDDVYAVWNGQENTAKYRGISEDDKNEYTFVFSHTVDFFSEQAYVDGGSVYFTGDARLKVGSSVPDIDSIGSDDTGIVYGNPIWIPNHSSFRSGVTYIVKIPLRPETGYVFTGDAFRQGSFIIESQYAELRDENGSYYITAAFTPDDIEGQIENDPDDETEGGIGGGTGEIEQTDETEGGIGETGQTGGTEGGIGGGIGETEEKYFDLELSYSKSDL